MTRVPGSRLIVLVGGGDPLLASSPRAARGRYPSPATTARLAALTARALHARGLSRVRLGYDDRLFTGPAVDPQWPASYVSEGVVPPISSLWVDEARQGAGYQSQPALAAAELFARQLHADGITVRGAPGRTRSGTGARTLAEVRSPPLAAIVQHTLAVSDNNAAEVIARHVGLSVEGRGSFAASTAAVRRVLQRLGVRTAGLAQYDGSGLSRRDRLDPRTLLDVLRLAGGPGHPALRAVVTGLPVAGFDGSLAHRYATAPKAGLGRVRAKTGTLTGVSALAGTATDVDGDLMYFAVMADRVSPAQTLAARQALDRITAALGACRCRRPPPGGASAGASP